ncbi:hypothetical protein [Flavobacterium johnsoniae]|uniref:Uncharacterized protein n=1 Tax=Flavobacterium johnsoniae (strain ATCC 17061 / DSM 2064 / JCM 8514 / BCRC 14874 / CCUG 350202 / NBRC 14942 / NCIMB 11054 / UW101) TaxID=376686 RepID=A5FAP4_FLAJ1|nr:hypothetical protein [Flavobacterium johnsoniae]ABQ07733.1 hypothetical protein Fjoh_4734 [Flavobacterium johnsoniae UW101]OXG01817.1 hypothetical protein B0A63_03930 [Flavobacterium johnsoniae UW101]WQG80427.1 hypothetical protein SR927_20690 [Flavobacterium johnsoniae UW101]SHL03810.1 hypothetical protein SAMN05444146_2744 [Flavobacterium johnsoniae]
MKTTLLFFLFFGFIGYSQDKESRIVTKIIEIDLSEPNSNSIKMCNDVGCTPVENKKWLSAKCSEMIAVKLLNANPFKYTYKIDTKEISFFNDQSATGENLKAKAKISADSTFKLLSFFPDRDKMYIKNIIDQNQQLAQGIDSLGYEVKSLYGILKQKNTLKANDYAPRKDFLNKAKAQLRNSYELLNVLEQFSDNEQYGTVKSSLIETKVKAEKSIDSIIEKFYSIDFDVYTRPIDVQGKNIDVVEFTINQSNKETKKKDENFDSKPYNIWIKGGLKIDVSAGVFFTSLYDSEFSTKDDPAIAGNKIITLKNGGDYDLAFGSTINTYMRMNSWVVPTLNFGAVITQNQKLQILLGGGLILGKQERIIFSGGLTMGKVTRIADSYSVGGSYNLGNSGDVPTQNQFKFGHFFGITYNLTKVKKISLDKGIEQN